MEERARHLAGTLAIERPATAGTRVTLRFVPASRRTDGALQQTSRQATP